MAHSAVLSRYGVDSGTVVVTREAAGRQESSALGDVIGYDRDISNRSIGPVSLGELSTP